MCVYLVFPTESCLQVFEEEEPSLLCNHKTNIKLLCFLPADKFNQTSTYAGGETGVLDPGGPLCWWLGGRRGTLCWGGDGGGMQGGGGTGGAVGSPVGRGGRGGRGAVLAVAALVSNMPVFLLGPGGGGGGTTGSTGRRGQNKSQESP